MLHQWDTSTLLRPAACQTWSDFLKALPVPRHHTIEYEGLMTFISPCASRIGVHSHFIEQLLGFAGCRASPQPLLHAATGDSGGCFQPPSCKCHPAAACSSMCFTCGCSSSAHTPQRTDFLSLPLSHSEPSSAFTPRVSFPDKTSPKPFCEPEHTSTGLKINPPCAEHFLPAPCDSDFTN